VANHYTSCTTLIGSIPAVIQNVQTCAQKFHRIVHVFPTPSFLVSLSLCSHIVLGFGKVSFSHCHTFTRSAIYLCTSSAIPFRWCTWHNVQKSCTTHMKNYMFLYFW